MTTLGDVYHRSSGYWQKPEPKETRTMHPATAHLMQFFAYAHLPAHLQDVSKPFCELAEKLASTLPDNAEKTAGLRKLLESKDCAVRALIAK